MWFTLAKGWLWFALAGLLGIVIGWLLRSIVARRQLLRARGGNQADPELDRLRGRIAELESAVSDRDRLRSELEACRAKNAAAAESAGGGSMPPPTGVADTDDPAGGSANAAIAGFAGLAPPTSPPLEPPDVGGATAVLGAPIALDDLKVIEGIGPKIEGLCHGIGIVTWADLAATEASLLKTMLTDAGPRFRTHDPSTWPQQAGLLAHGRWAEFKALTDELDGGRAPS